MSIRALFLRCHHLNQPEQWAGRDDSELVRYCFKTSVTNTVPEPTATELALQEKQLELAEFQLTELRRQSTLQQEFAEDIGPLLEQQTADAQAARERAERLDPIQDELLNLALEDLRRGGEATPEQIAEIEAAADAGIEAGGIDIERFRSESLEALREELAPSLGLRPSDTPILDRGSRVAAEATRQGGQLAAGFRGAAASARLNLPLAQSQILQAGAASQGQLVEATRQFQDQLRNQAFANRLNLQGSVGGLGLGLATGVPFNGASTLNLLQQDRFANSSQTSSGLGLSGFSSILGGIGGLLSGIGEVRSPSSSRLKTDKTPVDDEEVLEIVERLPVETWRYKDGLGLASEERHIGPYAEDMATLGLSDGLTINPVDVAGLGLAAVKGLAKRVARLERGGGLGLADTNDRGHAGLGLAKAA